MERTTKRKKEKLKKRKKKREKESSKMKTEAETQMDKQENSIHCVRCIYMCMYLVCCPVNNYKQKAKIFISNTSTSRERRRQIRIGHKDRVG